MVRIAFFCDTDEEAIELHGHLPLGAERHEKMIALDVEDCREIEELEVKFDVFHIHVGK